MLIYLIGLPGSGKTTLGKRAAEELNVPFIDLDEVVEERDGASISQIFKKKGELSFRKLESEALRDISDDGITKIIATGGGTPCFHNNMAFMKQKGKTIYINVPLSDIEQRLRHSTSQRPLLKTIDLNFLEDLLKKRKSYYEQAHLSVSTYLELYSTISQIKL